MKKIIFLLLGFYFPFFLMGQTTYVMDGSDINSCSGVFVDSGTSNGNYAANENFTTTICPTGGNAGIELSFNYVILGDGDDLCFFDGDSNTAPSLGCVSDFVSNAFTIQTTATNSSGCMTLTFNSDDTEEATGWYSIITCNQPCQDFDAQILSTTPAVTPPDTGFIDLCLGDSVFLSGSANFYQNNLLYAQDNSSSTFKWEMGDGTILLGENVSHAYQQAGGFYMVLTITDVNGCSNTNVVTQRIRVTGPADFNIENNNTLGSCAGDTITLIGQPPATGTFYFSDPLTNTISLPVPDGTGETLTSTINVSEYLEGATLDNESQVPQVCITMEHSWMRDLEISLTCPSGNSIILHNHAGNFGGEVFLGEPFEEDENSPVNSGVGYQYCFTADATNGTFLEYANLNFGSNGSGVLPAGNYNAFDTMTNLLGCPLNGAWTLSVQDLWGIDNGYIFNWSLGFQGGLSLDSESFSVNVANQGWLPNSSIFSNSGDTITAEINQEETFTYQVEYENGCIVDTSIVIAPIQGSQQACAPCEELVVDAGPDENFFCFNSQVTLDASGSMNGPFFEYEWTTIDGNFLSATNGLIAVVSEPGLYIFTLTSALTNCMVSDTVEVLPIQNAPIVDLGEDFIFPCNAFEVTIDGTNSSSGPGFSYQWDAANGGSILSGENTLTPVVSSAGIYLLQINNLSNQCVSVDTLYIFPQVEYDVAVTDATCDSDDGSISIFASVGNDLLDIEWSDGQVGATANNLSQGWYSVTITANDTCAIHKNIFVDEDLSCKVKISGNVFQDQTTLDCVEDNSTEEVSQIMLHLMPADIFTYSNAQGEYEFVVDNGDYSIELMLPPYFENLCPTDGIINVSAPTDGNIYADNDFYLQYGDGAFDLNVSCYMNTPRPGFPRLYSINYCNDGNETKSGAVFFTHDSIETNLFTSPLPQGWSYDESTQTATWTFTDLAPGECLTQDISFIIPADTPLGTPLTGMLSIVSSEGDDIDPNNNDKSWTQIVTGSFDPNDKQVFTERGVDQFGGPIYDTDTTLFYQIRFQNTGTDTAFTVVVHDTLDVAVLDVTTIQSGTSSHPYRLEFEGNNILIFNFENIMLPDSFVNEPASNGYVTFSIDRRLDLPLGTMIANDAAIFFDFNAPIITNEVVNTLSEIVAIERIENNQPTLDLSPNPNQGTFTISYQLKKSSETRFAIFDIYGKNVFEVENENFETAGNYSKDFSIDDLPNGIYFLQLKTTHGNAVKKFVKTE